MSLSPYELLRQNNIKRNNERLKELGLLDLGSLKKIKPKKKKSAVKVQRAKADPNRRSRRLSSKTKDGDLVMLDYSAKDGEETVMGQQILDFDYEDDNDDDDGWHSRSRRKRTIYAEEWKLSKEDLDSLASGADENFMAKFEEFLDFENRISHQNKRNVMRQARKLASGEGIRYESPRYGWPEGCYFMKGEKITPVSDIVALMIEGQACEDKWGRDHGNGWLISHPLKKLLLFQQFILNNPEFLRSKLRLNDYCGLASATSKAAKIEPILIHDIPEPIDNDGSDRFPLGTKIHKIFGNEEFTGKVVKYDNDEKLYKILYDDGDEEEMYHDEVRYYQIPRQ